MISRTRLSGVWRRRLAGLPHGCQRLIGRRLDGVGAQVAEAGARLGHGLGQARAS